jgi:hypothetical protein
LIVYKLTNNLFKNKKVKPLSAKEALVYFKDNYFFGVQSVDENGHESLVVIPKPGR